MVTGTLTPKPPFDFSKSLAFVGGFPPTRGEQAVIPAALTKAFRLAGATAAAEIRPAGAPEAPALSVRLHTEAEPSPGLWPAAADRLSFYLSLDDDLAPFYDLARGDAAFAPVLEKLYGYHQVKFPSPFENAVWAVLTQRTAMPVARQFKARLLNHYGGAITIDGVRHLAFPEPAVLAAAGPVELKAVLGHDQKARYIGAVAAAFAGMDETFLRHGPYAEVEAWLLGITGIGAWSANFVLIRGLGRMDKAPIDDKALAAAVGRVYGHSGVARAAERYGEWQGYWAHYLRVGG